MGLFSRLLRRGRAQAAAAELLSAPAVAEPAVAEPAPAETEPVADGEISPARLDAALQRLRDEHPPAPEG
ncbi:MAG: hypothetical protein KGL15_08405 [Acidobacteriota bacterium]|nr:hypothetical protein [Acidobacteriota bacterium]